MLFAMYYTFLFFLKHKFSSGEPQLETGISKSGRAMEQQSTAERTTQVENQPPTGKNVQSLWLFFFFFFSRNKYATIVMKALRASLHGPNSSSFSKKCTEWIYFLSNDQTKNFSSLFAV
jgi:hypothetical protein